ncbi:MAG: hypothetical protein LBE34_16510 [Flavobacteriaceae bacterium]|jgi:hypothetical protein|nr:hypothetical protein [Flavobacteriaceae bacterium]
MKTKLALFFGSIFLLISCNQKVEPPKTVDVADLYSMEIPGNLAEMKDLYDGADLQYGNTFTQIYLVAKHDAKTEGTSFDSYVAQAKATYENRTDYTVEKEDNIAINGLKGKIYELSMAQEKEMMFMIQAVVEGKKANYQIIAWTTAQNKATQTKNLMDIISTFKEK